MSDKLTSGILGGSVDLSLPVLLRKTSDATAETGVAHGDITAYYYRQGGSASVALTPAALTNLNDAHSDGGWKQVDATNQPGLYRLDVPDAMIATGADWVVLTVKTANSLYTERFDLTSKEPGNVLKINSVAAAAARLALSAGQIIPGTVNDATTTPLNTTCAASDITEATADHFNGRIILFTTGNLAGQASDITDYALVSGEGKFTFTAMTEAAADGDTFVVI